MTRRRAAIALVAGAVVVAAFVACRPDPPAAPSGDILDGVVDRRPRPPEPTPAGPSSVEEVRVEVGDDLQRLVEQHPPGTTFRIASGVHREVSVIPRDGDRFLGEEGAVLSGARDLSDADWREEDGRWVLGGQTQEGFVHGTIEEGGNARDRHPEQLFVAGRRLRHVDRVDDVGPDSWHLAYERDELWIGQDPGAAGSIEASTTVGAFGGTGVRDVLIEGLTIERYATPAQHGAIGFLEEHWTHDWTVRDVVVRQNHGAGIRLGPGMLLERVRVEDNGQLGIGGDGIDRSDGETGGYAAPVVIRDSEVLGNGALSFDWNWEAGGVKIKNAVAGSRFERNTVRGNDGPGAWWDIDDRDAVIVGNLVEDNSVLGIFYEISFGEALIAGNTVRANGPRDAAHPAFGVGIYISTSTGVSVRDNVVEDQAFPIVLHGTDRGTSERFGERRLADVEVIGNTIRRSGPSGLTSVAATGIHWGGNSVDRPSGDLRFLLGDREVDLRTWQERGFDRDLTLSDGTPHSQ